MTLLITSINISAYDKNRKLAKNSLFLANSLKFLLIMYSNFGLAKFDLSGRIAYFSRKMSGDWLLSFMFILIYLCLPEVDLEEG